VPASFPTRAFILLFAAMLGLCFLATPTRAQLSAASIPFAPHGAGFGDANGAAVPLAATSLLVPATGPDGDRQTDDDVTLLVTGIGGALAVTPLATPYLLATGAASQVVVLDASRALIASAGPDGDETTGDDVVYLLDDLGGANAVVPITVGFLAFESTWTPVRLAADSAAVVSGLGTLKLLSDLGGANTVTPLAAPNLRVDAGEPVVLGPTSLLLAAGAEGAGDEVYLFTDLGGTNERADLATPYLAASASGIPVPLDATRAMVVGAGPDGADETVDDGVYLLDDLGGANAVTFIPVASILGNGGGAPTMLNPDLVVLSVLGGDRTAATADDLVVIISDIGGSNLRRGVRVAGMASGSASRPVRMGATAFAVTTTGDDFVFDTEDDSVVVVTNVGVLNGLFESEIGGLGPGATTEVVRLSETALMVASGGPDHVLAAGADDVVTVVSGIPRAPEVRTVAAIGDFDATDDPHARPRLLGRDRAVFLSGGLDAAESAGEDDLIRVLAGLVPVPHFQCYDVAREPFDRTEIELDDQIGALALFDVKRPRRLCDSASKERQDPGALEDPLYLVGYELRRPEPRFFRLADLEVTTPFGTTTVDVLRPELLLVPSGESSSDPAPPLARDFDHYECYRVRGARERQRDLRIEDDFQVGLIDIKRPFRLCSPASASGSPLFDSTQHLMCYDIQAPRLLFPERVFIDNALGPNAVTPGRARELCVPAVVALP
jgi:hypothetical protein